MNRNEDLTERLIKWLTSYTDVEIWDRVVVDQTYEAFLSIIELWVSESVDMQR